MAALVGRLEGAGGQHAISDGNHGQHRVRLRRLW
jgi:hypothetical protein